MASNDQFDLNKVLQLSFNFDLLKSVLEELLKNQKGMQKDLQDMKNDNEEKDERIKKYIEVTYIQFNIDLRKI